MSQAPKFLLGGVNFKSNFLGLKTIQTAVYGWAELGIKVVPIFAFAYAVSKFLISLNIQRQNEYLLYLRKGCIPGRERSHGKTSLDQKRAFLSFQKCMTVKM